MKGSYLIFAAALVVLPGCASVTQGTSQTLAFTLEPKDAQCTLSRTGDGVLGSVSSNANTIQVHKGRGDIIVQCKAAGYADKTTRIVSKATTAGVTGVLIDFGITDMVTGAMFAYPSDINIVMSKAQEQGTTGQSDQANTNDKLARVDQAGKAQESKLAEIKKLHDSGLISNDVYESEQKEILKGN